MPSKKISELLKSKVVPQQPKEELTASEDEGDEGDEQHDLLPIQEVPVPVSAPVKKTKAVKKQVVPVAAATLVEPEEQEEDEEDDEDDEEVEEIKKPKRLKGKSDLRKYQNDKVVIKQVSQDIISILREFKFEIMKLFKTWKNEDLDDNDIEDIVLYHNELKQGVLQKLYDIEQTLSEQKIKLPKSTYEKIDTSFESAKERINILIS